MRSIFTSKTGVSWGTKHAAFSKSFFGVTYGNGVFVTVGSEGTIYTSSNGFSWTKINSGTLNRLFAVTYSK